MTTKEAKMQEVEIVEETPVSRRALTDNVHKVFQAGLGVVSYGQDAIVTAQDEVGDLMNKLLERGQALEKDGRRLVDEMIEKRKQQAEDVTDKAESQLEERVTTVLHRLNVPTKDDIDALSKKIDTLSRKINELKKSQVA